MKKNLLVILLIFVGLKIFPQPNLKPNTGIITGNVTDKDGNPLEYVSVSLLNQKDSIIDGTLTDSDGKFVFMNVPYGKYFLEIKFVGFKKRRDTVKLNAKNRFVRLENLKIYSTDVEVDKVVVSATENYVDYKIDKKVITISKDLSAKGGTAVDALRNAPSVQVDMEGNVSIRGSSNFTVLINGKPSILDGNEALQQISASSIEKIEIITNPSAKYDPDGVAGIINIITKKNARDGLSGKIELSADNFLGYNADFLLYYRKNKFEVFAEVNLKERIRKMQTYQQRLINGSEWLSEGIMQFGRGGKWFKTGAAYYFNDKNSLNFNVEYGLRSFKYNSFNTITENSALPKYDTSFSIMQGYSGKAQLEYEHKFNDKGHKISSYIQISKWDPVKNNLLTEYSADSIYSENIIEVRNNHKLRFQTDYELPINDKSKFEAGVVAKMMNMQQTFDLFKLIDNQFVKIEDFSNYLNFRRQILGGYMTYSNQIGSFGFKIGLRGEFTNRMIFDKNNNEYLYKKFDIFPTLHISKNLPRKQQLQFSYSRRINRPYGWFLNPSLMYIDKYTLQRGNPELKPEYVNSFELNYLKKLKNRSSFSIETYFRQKTNNFERYQIIEDNQLIYTWENIDKDISAGAELSTNLVLIKFIMLNASIDGYYYKLYTSLNTTNSVRETFTYSGKLMLMSFLPFGGGIQFGTFYNGPSLTIQGKRKAMYFSFLGISKSFLNKKLTVSFNVNDIFNTGKFEFTTEADNLYIDNKFEMFTTYRFSITYRINNYKQKNRKPLKDTDDMEGEGIIGGF